MKVELERAVAIQGMQKKLDFSYYAQIGKLHVCRFEGSLEAKFEDLFKKMIFLKNSIFEAWGRISIFGHNKPKNLRARPPENEFFRKLLIFMERSLNFASNEPSNTPDIRFKSSYARKLDFSLLCQNMEIEPQAPKNEFFKKNSFL